MKTDNRKPERPKVTDPDHGLRGWQSHLSKDILEEAGEEDLLAGLDEVSVEGHGVAGLVVHREPGQLVLRRILVVRAWEKLWIKGSVGDPDPDPDSLVRGTDPDLDPDSVLIKLLSELK